ncbi:unnamed protein product [Victoria cruziana]
MEVVKTGWVLLGLVGLLVAGGRGGEGVRIRHYRWEVKYEYRSPDCFRKLMITINGQSPGPPIMAQQGDTVVVELKNSLHTENVAVHWHGIHQIGTPWSDGVPGVTQCPILPGETFTYRFVLDKPGTYMYHSHYGIQRMSGFYGSIQVAVADGVQEPFSYDAVYSLLLNDWYHKSVMEISTDISTVRFEMDGMDGMGGMGGMAGMGGMGGMGGMAGMATMGGDPQSLLIEGRGRHNCSSMGSMGGSCNMTDPQCEPHFITVSPGKVYRLRIGNIASTSSLSFEIEGHDLTVVEADSNYVEPFTVKSLYTHPGETYSVLFKANQDPTRNYWISINVALTESNTPTGTAILNYDSNPARQAPRTMSPAGPSRSDIAAGLAQSLAIKAHRDHVISPPSRSHRLITLLITQNTINGFLRWSVNNISLVLPQTPHLIALKKEYAKRAPNSTQLPAIYFPSDYDIFRPPPNRKATYGSSVYSLKFGSVVDVILQNANTMYPNSSELHPWHLHGHDFWVLGYGLGVFDPAKDSSKLNLVDPIMKNTLPLFPFGWAALRFVADNPGVWIFHCHIDPDLFLGMGVIFEEGVDRVSRLPKSIMGCGKSKF